MVVGKSLKPKYDVSTNIITIIIVKITTVPKAEFIAVKKKKVNK